jgi:hypothetical protein
MDKCPRCEKLYELCECGRELQDIGGASEQITGRAVFRAACRMQRAGLPFSSGAERPDIERVFSTGKVGVPVDGYLDNYTRRERRNRNERKRNNQKT